MSTLPLYGALPVGLLITVIALLMLGYPVALTLAGTAVLFACLGNMAGAFDLGMLSSLPMRYWGSLTNDVLIAVPLFVFMGIVLERSKIAESLLLTMGQLFGRMRGGLGLSTVVVAVFLAASTGIVGATVITMGLISLPAMLEAGYDRRLASGLITASGSLAQIIPPSTVLVFMAVMLQSAYSKAQMEMGNFTPDTLSVGDIFAGALVPGLILAGAYSVWIAWTAFSKPAHAPALPKPDSEATTLFRQMVISLFPAIALIIGVLGSIVAGVATPTESASVGAVVAVMLAMLQELRKHLSTQYGSRKTDNLLYRFWMGAALTGLVLLIAGKGYWVLTVLPLLALLQLSSLLAFPAVRRAFLSLFQEAIRSALVINGMVFTLFLGASVFSLVFVQSGGDTLVEMLFQKVPGGRIGMLLLLILIMFVLGCFLDAFEIVFIVIPITAPVVLGMGVDPVWLAVICCLVLQTSYLTPPFGFSLFFLDSVAPPTVRMTDIYMGSLPFVIIQLACVGLVWFVPALATWLPQYIYGPA